MTGDVPVIPAELPAIRWRKWILAAVLALLIHALILFPKLPGLLFSPNALAPPRVDIKQVDPRKLEAIRKQWKQREKALLLDKNLHAPTATEPPPDARYMSDRNIRVEKEQRSKQTAVVPKPGTPGEPSSAQAPPKAQTKPAHKLPNLGNLGVPLPAAPTRPQQEPAPNAHKGTTANRRGGDDAGSQYVRDPNLPEGSENLLNAQESVYYSFYARLYESIGPVWQSRIRSASRGRKLQPGEYTTNLDVVFDKEGNIVAINQVAGSGIEDFDKAAAVAWRTVGRFPNPPSGLLNEEGQVHTGWTFTVQVNEGFGLDSMPPERVY